MGAMARHELSEPARLSPARLILFWLAVVWTCACVGATLVMLFMAVAQWTGLDPQPDTEAALGGIITAVMTASLAGGGAVVVREVRRGGLRVAPRATYRDASQSPWERLEDRPLLPRPGSVLRSPMRQLSQAESALAQVMRPLSEIVPADLAQEIWRAATDAATELRSVATRIEAVEVARDQAPPDRQPALRAGVAGLERRLTAGLRTYREMLAAAGDVVVAGTRDSTTTELTEATESLAGLAAALRELSPE